MTNLLAAEAESAELLVRANALRVCEEYRAAIDLYIRVLGALGESPALLAEIAHCYYRLAIDRREEIPEDSTEAIRWMERAVALAPGDASLHAALGEYYELVALDYGDAACEYRKAVKLAPCGVAGLVGAARLYDTPDDVVTLAEAVEWLERAVRQEPDNPSLRALLGTLYDKAGRSLDAQKQWVRALLCPSPLNPAYEPRLRKVLGLSHP